MVREPKSGDGTQLSAHYLASAVLTPPRHRTRALYSQAGPLGAGVLADGSLSADPAGRSWRGAGGMWLLWPLRFPLWAALLIVVFRGVTAIVVNFMELGVPVAASGGGVVVSGEPAWLPAPPQAAPPPAAPGRSDPVAQGQLGDELPAFFRAYASGDSAALSRVEVRGVSLTGLGGAVTFDSIAALHVPPGGTTRQITVTVIWQLPQQAGSAGGNPGMASKLEMTYGMSVVDLHSGKWYVKEIGATTEAVGVR